MSKGKFSDWLTDEGVTQIEAWARDGLTDEQIAENIGISRSTLSEWKKKYPAISAALKRGKAVVDIAVENALLKRALGGYRYDEITREQKTNPDTGEKELVTTKIVTKETIPDVTAQIFWLKNRKPEVWRDKHDLQSEVNTEAGIIILPAVKEAEE
ncbi:MAG: helix-turn-helix domain-containing protein [Clostridia bacterium]|nr:helix-turn-helix domain-containing protein [Clostridia bacterium]